MWTVMSLGLLALTVGAKSPTLSNVAPSSLITSSLDTSKPSACVIDKGIGSVGGTRGASTSGVSVNIRLLKSSETSGWEHTSYKLTSTTGSHSVSESFRGNGKIDDHSICVGTDRLYSFGIGKIEALLHQEEEAMIGAFVCGKFVSPGENVVFRALSTGKCTVSEAPDRAAIRTTLGDANGGGLVLQTMDGRGLGYSMPYSYSGAYVYLPTAKPSARPTLSPTPRQTNATAGVFVAAVGPSKAGPLDWRLFIVIPAFFACLCCVVAGYNLRGGGGSGGGGDGSKGVFMKLPDSAPGGHGSKAKKYIKVPLLLPDDSAVSTYPQKLRRSFRHQSRP